MLEVSHIFVAVAVPAVVLSILSQHRYLRANGSYANRSLTFAPSYSLSLSMAAAAPKTLASDSLEVTRSSHLLSLQHPTPHTQKALSASSMLLKARAEKKAARQARNNKKNAVGFEGGVGLGDDEEMDEESGDESEDSETEELGVAQALREAEMGGMEVDDEAEEKVKSKVKATKKKSALKKMGGAGMAMGMDA